MLDLGGFVTGAVAQIVTAADHPGLWIKPLAADGALPSPEALKLDRGDVAFLDQNGVALALSTRTRHADPDFLSGPGVLAHRRRALPLVDHSGFWLIATGALLFCLQRMFRKRPADASE